MKPTKYKIRKMGFELIDTNSQKLEIYGKNYDRIVYDPENEREVTRFKGNRRYFTKRGLSQVIFNGRRDLDAVL